MKKITKKDSDGKKNAFYVVDQDEDFGLPANPPDIWALDWEEVKMEIHNMLVDKNLITYKDLCKPHSGLESGLISILKPRIVRLFKSEEL